MDRVYKIVVTGPFNSGKTTFINAISEIEVVSTERKMGRGSEKCDTTVAMDFGRITFPDGYSLHLYGTPGQARFDFMWEILSEGMLGYVVLVDGSKPSSFGEVDGIVRAFAGMSDKPCVVGLTRSDHKDCFSADEIRNNIDCLQDKDIVGCDARKLTDVKEVLLALLEKVMARAEALEQTG
ncbi:MAG: GTP-binding protein [Candidatus Anoxymicrobium japonicum]|uniref:GTP-binding protein n=1 Tax=Candidatus Anoxymicrobium japonicum TaxID=2013648 RepID=A0A2N3G7F0_9ACTN|nr:MAG: GTP-binding protein [Candidatus Anoxymicrobium japonicum]